MTQPELWAGAAGTSASVWRGGPAWNGAPSWAVGRFACPDAEAGAALLGRIAAAAAQNGVRTLLAPLDGDTWHAYRLRTAGHGRPHFALEPPADPVLQAALGRAGFAPALDYESALLPLGRGMAAGFGARDLSVRPFALARAEADLAAMHGVALKAFAGTPLFTPIAVAAFTGLFRSYIDRTVPDLVLIAEDAAGAPVGFLFGLPDWAEGAAPRTAILKTYAAVRPGAGSLLAARFHQVARGLGFDHAIHALMRADNRSRAHSRRLGAVPFRRYALFARRLPA